VLCVYYTRCVVVCQALATPLCVLPEVESTRAIALMILEVLGFGFGFAGGFRVSPRSQCLPPSASHAEFRGPIVGSFAGAILALAFAPRCRVLFFGCHLLFLLVLLLGLLFAPLLYSVAFWA